MTTSMKFRFAVLAAALAFSPLTAALHAQTGEAVQVKIPFAFQNGSQVLPAGVYTITQVTSRVLSIIGPKNGGTTMSQRDGANGSFNSQSKVVFQRYGDKYFLREVWRSGSREHAVVFKTSEETRAEKAAHAEIADANAPASSVEVASMNASR